MRVGVGHDLPIATRGESRIHKQSDIIADTPQMVAVMQQMGRPASHVTRATFSEFEPRRRLTLIHVIDFIPGVPAYESRISVDFRVADNNVKMSVELGPMHDEDMSRMQRMGFTSRLAKLDRRFASP